MKGKKKQEGEPWWLSPLKKVRGDFGTLNPATRIKDNTKKENSKKSCRKFKFNPDKDFHCAQTV